MAEGKYYENETSVLCFVAFSNFILFIFTMQGVLAGSFDCGNVEYAQEADEGDIRSSAHSKGRNAGK